MAEVASGLDQWDEEYLGHPVWDTLDTTIAELQSLLREVEDPELNGARLLLLLRLTRGYAKTPSLLVGRSMLEGLNNAFTALIQAIQAYRNSPTPSYLTRVFNSDNQIIELLRGWPNTDNLTLHRSAAALRIVTKETEDRSAEFEEKSDELINSISLLQDRASELARDFDALVSKVEGHFESIELAAQVKLAELEDTFGVQEEDREKRFTESQNNLNQQFNDSIKVSKDEARKTLDYIEQKKSEAEAVVGAIGVFSTASAYQQYANQQRFNANWMRAIAILLYLAAFALLAWSVYFADHADSTWESTAVRLLSSASLLAGAVYTSRESTKHREHESKAKATEIKLLALEPFMAPLESDFQKSLRYSVARDVFVTHHNEVLFDDEPGSEQTLTL